MKTKTENGAGTRAAKTPHPDRLDRLIGLKRLDCCREGFIAKCRNEQQRGGELEAKLDRAGVEWDDLPVEVQVMVAQERSEKATVRLEMELPAWVYGQLCAAAVVNGQPDWKAALAQYLYSTVTDWSNNGYIIDP